MIYRCDDCSRIFKEPIIKKQPNQYYEDDIYITHHCPDCNSQGMSKHYALYEYEGIITPMRDDIVEMIELEHGECNNELFEELVYIYS